MKFLNERAICPKCKQECHVYKEDDGYNTDRGWYSVIMWYSDCCRTEVDENDLITNREGE